MKINEAKKLMDDIHSGKEKTLQLNDKFKFKCTACGRCCFNINVLLNSYDVIRLRTGTGLSTTELLKKDFLAFHIGQSSGLPVCQINFEKLNKEKRVTKCPFLMPALNVNNITKDIKKKIDNVKNKEEAKKLSKKLKKELKKVYEGKKEDIKIEKWLCNIHKHRPLVCRFYPCGRIKEEDKEGNKEEHWILQEPVDWCPGFKTDKKISLRRFLKESEFYHYNKGSDKFESILKNIVKSGFFVPTEDNKNEKKYPPKLKKGSKIFLILANMLYNFDSFEFFSEDKKVIKTIKDKDSTHKDFMYVFKKITTTINLLIQLFKECDKNDKKLINYLKKKGGINVKKEITQN